MQYGLSYPGEDLLEALDIDTRRFSIGNPDGFKVEYTSDRTFVNEWGGNLQGSGSGYLPMSSHVIQHDTPPENVIPMYDAIKKYGTYPICN